MANSILPPVLGPPWVHTFTSVDVLNRWINPIGDLLDCLLPELWTIVASYCRARSQSSSSDVNRDPELDQYGVLGGGFEASYQLIPRCRPIAGSYGRIFRAIRICDGRNTALKAAHVGAEMLSQTARELWCFRDLTSMHVVEHFGMYEQDGDDVSILSEWWGISLSECLALMGWSRLAPVVQRAIAPSTRGFDAEGVQPSASLKVHIPRLTEQEVAAILKQCLIGLKFIHTELRSLARHIKAGNIQIDAHGVCKLADMCLPELANAHRPPSGSPFWLAPERIDGQRTTASDIWSIGITAIELTEGRPPHWDLDPQCVLSLIGRTPPPTLKDESKSSPPFVDFIATCLRKDPSERATVTQLLQHPFIAGAGGSESLLEWSCVASAVLHRHRDASQQEK